MGPLELADYVGLDTTKFIIEGEWSTDLNNATRILWCVCVCLSVCLSVCVCVDVCGWMDVVVVFPSFMLASCC